jgi:hypothetical protein
MRSGGLHLHFFSISLSPQQMTGGKRQQAASATSRSGRREVPGVEGVGRGERGDKLSTVALFLGRSAKVLRASRARHPENTSQAQRAI